jgi:uncharacterized protein with HXXEE motif
MGAVLFDWPYIGLAVTPMMLAAFALERRPADAVPRFRDPASVLPLLWPMYLIHQFEEHGVDLLGRRYAFLGELCAVVGHAGDPGGCPADPAFIFAVNGIGCQIAFALALIFRRKRPLIAACAWGIPIVNAVTHVGSAIARGAYNPGVLTSLLLFAPMSAWMLHTVLKAGVVERRQIPRIIATGAVVHAVLLGSLLLHAHGWLSQEGLLVVNGANGLWPLAFGRIGVPKPAVAPAAEPAS